MHHVVAGALVRAGRVLLGHRHPSRRWYPDVWDLPGGHVEPGESEPRALVREMHEELGVRVLDHDPAPAARFELSGDAQQAGLRLSVRRVRQWQGVPVNRCPDEHDEVAWFAVGDLGGLRLAHPGYRELLHALAAEPDAPGSAAHAAGSGRARSPRGC